MSGESFFRDAHPSPDFPDRPDHEDFRLMADLIQDLDRQAEAGVPVDVLMPVHVASVAYVADQRLIRALGVGYIGMPRAIKANLIALYFDAFTLGASFNQRRHDAQAGTAGEGSSS